MTSGGNNGEGGVATGAREQILARIRGATGEVGSEGRDSLDLAVERAYRKTGDSSREERLALLVERLEDYGVTVQQVSRRGLSRAIEESLGKRGVEKLVVPVDFPSELLPAGPEIRPDEKLTFAELDGSGGVITGCALAIAQTGTIIMDGGARQGRRALSLLPDYHLCIVEAQQVVELVPEAVTALRQSVEAGMPLTFISGPSATSDIELIRVEGVHGPRTLDVLLVNDER